MRWPGPPSAWPRTSRASRAPAAGARRPGGGPPRASRREAGVSALDALAWPAERLAEAIESVARRSGWRVAAGGDLPLPRGDAAAWIAQCAQAAGVDSEDVAFRYASIGGELAALGPAV